MELKRCGYEIELRGDEIKELEEKILESGMCSFTVPMWFSRKKDKVKITYECSGYVALRDMGLKKPREVFEILEKTLLTLNRSLEFFIPPENIKLSLDTVFFHMTKRIVKIAYIPDENKNLTWKINNFLDELQMNVAEDTKEYLVNIKEDLNSQNKSLRDMASFINEQRRKLNICGRGKSIDESLIN